MDLDKVTYLLALADTRNYSRAAEQCHISQPALTRYIKNLEEELNVTLFDRSSFPIRLTYAGERYIDGLLKILEMKEKLDKEMREIAGHVQNQISIGMHSTRCYSWLPRILPDYQKICPKVKVKLSEGNSAKLQKDVKNGAIDVFFICSKPSDLDGLTFVPLFQEEMTLIVSRTAAVFHNLILPENIPGVLQYIPPRILEQIPFISLTPGHGTYEFAREQFKNFQISPSVSMELDNSATVYRLVPQNNGFGFAPVTVTYEEKFDYTPIFCSMDHHVSSREIGLLYRDSSSLSPAARQFIQTAREVIPSFVRSEIPHFEVREDINFS